MEVKIINIEPGTELYNLIKSCETKKTGNKKTSYIDSYRTKASYDTFVRTTPRSRERMAQIAKRKRAAKKQRIAAVLSALGITLGVLTGVGTGVAGGDKSNIPDTTISETIDFDEEVKLQTEQEALQKAEEEARLKAEEEARLKAEEEARLNKINKLNQLLEENPDIAKAYNNIKSAVETFGSQIGENGFELINKYVEELGGGKVKAEDVYKILFIESSGRIYDSNGEYLTSSANAYGPFQIRKIAETDINLRYGTNYNVLDPYDNLSVNILLLRWLNDYRTQQINNGVNLPTGNNLQDAILWGYHAGAYADELSQWDQDYIDKFNKLSVIDNYPELYDMMRGKLY